MEAILRVYNTLGRRDNIYKARIKILVRELKPAKFIEMIEDEFTTLPADRQYLEADIVQTIRERFVAPAFKRLSVASPEYERMLETDADFGHWVQSNTHPHRQPGYISAVVSLKPAGGIPGDISADEMVALGDLAEAYSLNEIRVSHEQNLVLPHVELSELFTVWKALRAVGLATPNIGLISDSIACPGMDYCSLATARSIPVAQRVALRFDEVRQREIGDLKLNVSGCINACAHHHVAHIGILGLDKSGKESYQISLGGSAGEDAVVGTILGPSVSYDSVPDVIECIVDIYLKNRNGNETFIDTYRRVGIGAFKEALHDAH